MNEEKMPVMMVMGMMLKDVNARQQNHSGEQNDGREGNKGREGNLGPAPKRALPFKWAKTPKKSPGIPFMSLG